MRTLLVPHIRNILLSLNAMIIGNIHGDDPITSSIISSEIASSSLNSTFTSIATCKQRIGFTDLSIVNFIETFLILVNGAIDLIRLIFSNSCFVTQKRLFITCDDMKSTYWFRLFTKKKFELQKHSSQAFDRNLTSHLSRKIHIVALVTSNIYKSFSQRRLKWLAEYINIIIDWSPIPNLIEPSIKGLQPFFYNKMVQWSSELVVNRKCWLSYLFLNKYSWF